MKIQLFVCLLSLACLAHAQHGPKNRIRHARHGPKSSIRRELQAADTADDPEIVGDVFSTMINESSDSALQPNVDEEDNSIMFEIMFRERAPYTTVHFSEFDLGQGCSMKVSGKDLPDGRKQQYKMAGKGKMQMGSFWTQHVKDDTMYIKVLCAQGINPSEQAHFVIDEVAVGFIEESQEKSEADIFKESVCGTPDFENAICYASTTQYQRGRALARQLKNGIYVCTGWLVSSSNHLITNEHCITDQEEARNTDFEFLAEAPSCDSANCRLCHSGELIISGADLIKDSKPLDYALVQFTSGVNPAATYGFLEIDNRPAVLNEQIYIPQHPRGFAKEFGIISTHAQDNGLCRINSLSETACDPDGTHQEYGYFCDTEGGSSGSPVLAASSNRVIALHHCAGERPKCSQTAGNPNAGVPIALIFAEISNIIGGEPAPTTPPQPTPLPTPAPTPAACPTGFNLFQLGLRTDDFGGETTWQVTDCSGTVLVSGGPYASDASFQESSCLRDGFQYTFTIFDSAGDGVCCEYGLGAYSVFYSGVQVGRGQEFGFSESTQLGGSCPVATPGVYTFNVAARYFFDTGMRGGSSDSGSSDSDDTFEVTPEELAGLTRLTSIFYSRVIASAFSLAYNDVDVEFILAGYLPNDIDAGVRVDFDVIVTYGLTQKIPSQEATRLAITDMPTLDLYIENFVKIAEPVGSIFESTIAAVILTVASQ